MIKPCYFHHIPKTAGISVHVFLSGRFSAEVTCPAAMWDQMIHVPQEDFGRFQLFRGHFMTFLESFIGRTLTSFTVLRDPVRRSISHYYHVRNRPAHPFHTRARELSLYDFCLADDTRHMIENLQTAYLIPEIAPVRLMRTYQGGDRAFPVQIGLERALSELTNPDAVFRAARQTLESYAAVGITERLGDSLRLFSHVLNCAPPDNVPRENVGDERVSIESIDSRTLDVIRSLTTIDEKLYQYALARFEHDTQLLA